MTSVETRTCQNCKTPFVIEPDDFAFYEKMQVPAPTWCPECRLRRRMLLRNERNLYKRKCDAPRHSEELISMYAPEKNVVVYDQKYWWGDGWDPLACGHDYDFTRPFFEQFKELWSRVPLLALSNSNATNSDYCNIADESRDSYLCSGTYKIERCLYSNRISSFKDSMDCYVGFRSELCYECVQCNACYELRYGQNCINCTNSYFLYDCRGCSDCVGCTNLRNKKYCIFNEQYSKEEYGIKLKELKLGSRAGIADAAERFEKLRLKSIHRFAQIHHSLNVTGDNIEDAKNSYFVFDATQGIEDSKYVHWALEGKMMFDAGPGCGVAELVYEGTDTGLQSANVAFTNVVYGSHDIRYALYCHASKNLFGCISLRSKEYCILNKQYSKEEYERLVPKIIEHMNAMPYRDALGREYRYGEYFPPEIVPFAYNESIARDYLPMIREEAKEQGFAWHEERERHHAATVPGADLPDSIAAVTDDIKSAVIGCMHGGTCPDGCTVAFRIVPEELSFYRKFNLPLPQLCFNCRHAARLNKRNPLHLWTRQCMCDYTIYPNTAKHAHHVSGRCSNMFETTFAPERPEIVYCEPCYQAEIL